MPPALIHFAAGDVAELRLMRYDCTENVEDLNVAITDLEAALATFPENHRGKQAAILVLAESYRYRAKHLNSSEDAQKAKELQDEVLRCVREGQSDRGLILLCLSQVYLLECLPEHDTERAFELYFAGITDKYCAPLKRLTESMAALRVFQDMAFKKNLSQQSKLQLLRAYRSALGLLPKAAYCGLDVQARFHTLGLAPSLAADAAAHALYLSQPQEAVELLEDGRAVFWAQHLRLRSAFDDLPEDISKELKFVSASLQSGAKEAVCPSRNDEYAMVEYEAKLTELRRLSERFDSLVAYAHTIPGFKPFTNSTFFEICMVAQTIPVVVLLATQDFCGTVLLRGPTAGAEQLRLENVTLKHLKQLISSLRTSTRSARATVGTRIVIQKASRAPSNAPDTALAYIWRHIMQAIITRLGLKVCLCFMYAL